MATKLLKAQSQIHEWEEGGSNHPFNSSYAYWMMKKEATLKWFIWPKCDRSSLCSCDLLPHLSVLSLFACLVKNKRNVSHRILALFLFFCILHGIQSNQCIQPRSEFQLPTHVIPTLMHMPALPLVGSTLVASSELSNENIGIYIGPRFILIHIGDQAAKSSELLPYTSTCKAV